MAILARDQITLTDLTDVSASTTYYLLQTSTLTAPSKPTVKSPTGWTTTEPTVDTSKSLYVSTRTDWSNGEFTWSDVSLSSSYEAAKAAYNKATTAQATADAAAAAASANSTDLTNYITSNTTELSQMQSQIDGSIATWFYEVAPTADNAPTKDWTTTDLKNNHLGDLYYDTITGYCYRYQVVNNVYSWSRITDTDVTKALSDAAKAQDTADNKRRVFVTTPTPPYDIGDQWVQGSAGDILICSTAKTNGQTYVASDWTKASKYTDDTKANAAQSTADSAKSTAEGIQVGGTNLYLGTKNFSGAWINLSNWTIDGTANGCTRLKRTGWFGGLRQFLTVKVGETYTFSGWLQGDGRANVFAYFGVGTSDSAVFDHPATHFGVIPTTPTRFSASATVTADGTMGARFENAVSTATMWIWGLKLERGNKATDWSPAPEDVDSGISDAKAAGTAAQATADGISVGGRNLLKGTGTVSGSMYPSTSTTIVSVAGAPTTKAASVTKTWDGPCMLLNGCSLTSGSTYTLSVYVSSTVAFTTNLGLYGLTASSSTDGYWRNVSLVPGTWNRLTLTFAATAYTTTAITARFEVTTTVPSGTAVLFCGWKLESGNRATDWTPAPEDTSASITESKNIATSAYQRASYLYGTCATEATTVAKVATVTNFPSLYTGATCAIKFTYANNIDSPTLNVSSTGAKPIFAYGAALTIASGYSWTDNSTVSFVYDGTNWVMVDPGSLDKANEANSIANSAINTANGAQTAANTANDAASAAATAAQTAQTTADAASSGIIAANTKITDLTSTTDTLRQNVKDLTDDSVTWNNLSKNVRVSDDLIVIGVPPQNGQIAGDILSLELSSGKISFLKGSNEVAYVSGDKLYINSGVFVTSLIIGNFEFVPRSNGNMSFKKVG